MPADATPDEPPFARAVLALTGQTPPRVWSLIITLFGDLAQEPGAEIATPTLSRVLVPAGVRPEALRVALHRLRRDGWLVARRQGRVSLYRLSDEGRTQSAQATPRIYATEPPLPERWHLVALPPGHGAEPHGPDLADLGLTGLGRGLWLGTGDRTALPMDAFVFEGAPTIWPDWLRARLGPPDLIRGYGVFERALDQAQAALPPDWHPLPEQAATLRMLAVHGWRRLVLRHPPLPAQAFPEGWRAEACRIRLHALLARLPRPAPDALASQTHVQPPRLPPTADMI